jgi:hypothetical protein
MLTRTRSTLFAGDPCVQPAAVISTAYDTVSLVHTIEDISRERERERELDLQSAIIVSERLPRT